MKSSDCPVPSPAIELECLEVDRRMPYGQGPANAAWFRVGAMACNLSLLQQASGLPPELLHVTASTVAGFGP